jgi:acetyltransferase
VAGGKFDRLFSPRAIAVVGVSRDPVRPGSQTVRTLLANGYRGRIFPVNPNYPDYEGLRCYPSVAAIEAEVDVAVVGIPAPGVKAVIAECAAKRISFAAVLSGGFREAGTAGAALQDELVALARASGMRLVGPNCLGYANIHDNVYAAFGSITRPPKLMPGPVSLVTQSGGFGYSLALACAEAGIGFRNVIATGNEADLDAIEFMDALIDDPATQVVVAYIEGLACARPLLELGRRAARAGKPLLIWKGGITGAGARAAATHTANLTGSYDFYRAAFRQAGIMEIREIHEAVDLVKALNARKLPAGRRIAVMGGSGGSAIVLADAGEQAGLAMAGLSPRTMARISEVIPAIGSAANPVDFTAGYIAGSGVEKFRAAVQAVVDDAAVDAVCINFATTAGDAALAGAVALGEIARTTGKPLFAFLSTPPGFAADALAVLDAQGVPTLPSPVRVARTLAALASYRELRERVAASSDSPAVTGAGVQRLAIKPRMSESASKAILERIGIAVTRDLLVQSADEVPEKRLRAPLAVKISSPDISHKTDIGAVRLNVNGREALRAAVGEVLAAARSGAPGARIEGVIVSEMVTGGVELLAGVINDGVFGPVVVLGAGGVYAEALKDRTCRIAPFSREVAIEMPGELRCAELLRGWRGNPPVSLEAIADVLVRLSRFAWDHRDTVSEIDINPLIATPQAAVAADALIVGRDGA